MFNKIIMTLGNNLLFIFPVNIAYDHTVVLMLKNLQYRSVFIV